MISIFLAFLCAILIGLSLGILGAGGAVLTIPVFVYLLKIPVEDAITCSLFVVCLSSLSATLRNFTNRQIDWNAVVFFGLPSILSVWVFRSKVLPVIPDPVLVWHSYSIPKSSGLLFLFSVLMITSAYRMLRSTAPKNEVNAHESRSWFEFVLNGLFVGAITGLLGAGGGFLIVPALVLFLGLDFKTAAASSLCIIFLNTFIGLISKVDMLQNLPWNILLAFTGITVLTSFWGVYLSTRLDTKRLKPAFAFLLLLVAAFMLGMEFLLPKR